MKIYKIQNRYVALTRTTQGGYIDYAPTRLEAITKGLERVKATLYKSNNLLIL